jgi:GGDEF domain-containing protein
VGDDLRGLIAECSLAVDHERIHLAASIGFALIDAQTTSDDAVLAAADRAMYRDKARRTIVR